MHTPVDTVTEVISAEAVHALLKRTRHGAFPVVRDNGHGGTILVGIVLREVWFDWLTLNHQRWSL